ncbi:DnaJ family domain-containing protein [Viridibacterium curvum]|uniref:DnaJ homologue subfamily C member 28 conserved domain-containing protein n=1 Tax=Viridibacterium curvum TaxID=1101404 RepID=A0ABP9QJP7_9RHOO
MSHATDSEFRRKRDAALRTQDELIAEHLAQSLRSGELQTAESFGKPFVEPEGYAETPLEFRLPFRILKNAGMPPPEVEMFHKRAALRAQVEAETDVQARQVLQQKLSELEQAIALRLEGMRVSGRI